MTEARVVRRRSDWFPPPWLWGVIGALNVVLAFVQNDGDARWYRVCFGVVLLGGALQGWVIETLAAELDELRERR